jgi:hypothetical protein
MRRKPQLIATVVLVSLGAASACDSGPRHAAESGSVPSGLGGQAPATLVGTFKTRITRRDATRAPKPDELPIGPWTLVIGNRGGPGNGRALGVGNGDTDRVVYRFGVSGNRLSIGCNDEQGLPASGVQTYTWSVRLRTLRLRAASAACRRGDPNNQLILTAHPWVKQGTN